MIEEFCASTKRMVSLSRFKNIRATRKDDALSKSVNKWHL